MKCIPKLQRKSEGFIMPVLLFTVAFIMLMITIVTSISLTSYNLATRESFKVNAQMAADAGLDASINELNLDQTWTTTSGEVTLLDTPKIRTTYEATVLAGATTDRRILSVTARSYSPSSATTPKITRRYELDLQAVTTGNDIASVVTGVGGLTLNNNSKITGGDVVVNGTISMDNQAQIGTQTNSVNVRVAHRSCPQPATSTFPDYCTSAAGQPISMSNNSRIYADVQANNQISGTNMFSPGLTATSGVAHVELPGYDRTLHAGATVVGAGDAGIRCPNNGNVNWPANIKIVGNYSLGNNCRVTINGNVWITGNITTGNNGEIYIANGLGTTRPVMMVDGQTGFTLSNNGEIFPNSSGTGLEVRTFWSHSTSGCSPDCVNLTGVGLANSQSTTTINLGNNGNAPNSVFIAEWSRVNVSNNGALGAVAGQSINLSNQAIINFTASVPGSDNLTQTWVKRGYMRVFD